MRKSLIALAVAGFAVATTSVGVATPAQAKGKGFGIGLGVGLVVGGIIASQHHHHHQRRVVTQPRPYPTATRPQAPAAPVVRTADDQGRFYDTASKTWFDGRSQCFTGPAGWTFKSGGWFYGTANWGEKDGLWQASTGAMPTPVECTSVPAVAARLPKQAVDKTAVVVTPSTEDHAAALIPNGQQATLGTGGDAASESAVTN